ncbi:MAG: ABC transporter substrate-binding protein [Terricaulis sp.]
MNRPVSRATFLSGLLGLGALAVAPNAYAARNADAETFVRENATRALAALGNASPAQREQQFRQLMTQFADTRRIALFVLGRYRGALEADPTLRSEWLAAFEQFAIANYQTQFSRFNGAAVTVSGSDQKTDTVVEVVSNIRPRGGDSAVVTWKVMRSGSGWRVTDIAIGADAVWLGQIQQGLFMRQLDREFNGDLRRLLADVRERTDTMRRTTIARS